MDEIKKYVFNKFILGKMNEIENGELKSEKKESSFLGIAFYSLLGFSAILITCTILSLILGVYNVSNFKYLILTSILLSSPFSMLNYLISKNRFLKLIRENNENLVLNLMYKYKNRPEDFMTYDFNNGFFIEMQNFMDKILFKSEMEGFYMELKKYVNADDIKKAQSCYNVEYEFLKKKHFNVRYVLHLLENIEEQQEKLISKNIQKDFFS